MKESKFLSFSTLRKVTIPSFKSVQRGQLTLGFTSQAQLLDTPGALTCVFNKDNVQHSHSVPSLRLSTEFQCTEFLVQWELHKKTLKVGISSVPAGPELFLIADFGAKDARQGPHKAKAGIMEKRDSGDITSITHLFSLMMKTLKVWLNLIEKCILC